MHKQLIMGIALVLATSSCVLPEPTPPGIPIELTPSRRAAVEAGVRESLKDPESARFGRMWAARQDDTIHVCGYVNAKNSFGGYTGDSLFAGILVEGTRGRVFLNAGILGPDAAEMRVGRRRMCAEHGIVFW